MFYQKLQTTRQFSSLFFPESFSPSFIFFQIVQTNGQSICSNIMPDQFMSMESIRNGIRQPILNFIPLLPYSIDSITSTPPSHRFHHTAPITPLPSYRLHHTASIRALISGHLGVCVHRQAVHSDRWTPDTVASFAEYHKHRN